MANGLPAPGTNRGTGMKLTTVVIAVAALAGAAAANSAAANAVVFEGYDYTGVPPEVTSDGAVIDIENTGSVAFTDVSVTGSYLGGSEDFGALAAGATTGQFYLGDNESTTPGSDGSATVTITIGTNVYSGTFTDVLGDLDVDTPLTIQIGSIATSSVPEPATWALMLAGFAGLGAMVRSRRKATLTA